jgi:hypothetical protein
MADARAVIAAEVGDSSSRSGNSVACARLSPSMNRFMAPPLLGYDDICMIRGVVLTQPRPEAVTDAFFACRHLVRPTDAASHQAIE